MNHSPKGAALVTGGAIRLGKHIAYILAKAGYDIAIHYNSSANPAEETAQEIRELGVKCEIFQLNLLEIEKAGTLLEEVKASFPHLSVLVNSASGYTLASIADTTPEIFDHQFALNIRAPFFLTREFARINERGNVVNIIDNKVGFNQYHYAAYLLAKKSLVDFTKMAALEFAPGIRVNGLAPGLILPAATRSKEYMQWRLQGIPLHMQGNVNHISAAALALLENEFVNGQVLTVDGGENIAQIGRNAGQFDPSKI